MHLNVEFYPKQLQAYRSLTDNKVNEVCYGGGARGGKSWLGVGWEITEALSKPESVGLIAREDFTKLRDTTMNTFFKFISKYDLGHIGKFNGQSSTYHYKNGSKTFFKELKHIPSDPEYDRVGSYDLTRAFIDEAQQIRKKALDVLKGRFSVTKGHGWSTIPKVLYTNNPSKGWIYSDFYKPYREGKLLDTRVFIKALVTDNPSVDQTYIDFLMQSDEVTKQRLLYGNYEYDDDDTLMLTLDEMANVFTNSFVSSGKRYITIDVARLGKDKTVIKVWDGFRVIYIYANDKTKINEIQDKVQELSERFHVPLSNIIADEDGVGGGLVDYMGVKGFVNNSKALNGENYANLKTQCAYKLAEKIKANEMYVEPTPYQEAIKEELGMLKRKDQDKDGKLKMISKPEMIQLLGRSTDFLDPMILRMYFDIIPELITIKAEIKGSITW